MIIDATNMILGRLSTRAAKAALEGEKVRVINAEKAFVVGSKNNVFSKYKHLADLGNRPNKTPYIPKRPEKMVRRSIKGMLPNNSRGIAASKNVKCYIGVPEELKGKEAEVFEEASISKLKTPNRVKIEELCEYLGWQKTK